MEIISGIGSIFATALIFIGSIFTPGIDNLNLSGGPGTINQLDQWKNDGTNITQNVADTPIKLTGLESLDCIGSNSSGILQSGSCGGGGGGSADHTFPFDPATDWSSSAVGTSTLVIFDGGIGVTASSTFSALLNFGNATGTQITLTDLFISGDQISDFAGTGLSVTGGTLNAEVQSSDLHDAVTLAGSLDYLTLSGQEITRNAIDLTTDVTGVLPDANVANDITLDNLTQLTVRNAGDLQNFGDPFFTFFNATTTDALSEGATNFYYTEDRFASSLAGTTTDALAEGSTNLYNQTHTGEVTGATALTIANDIIEAINLETTNSASDNQILSYDSGSGGFTWINDDTGTYEPSPFGTTTSNGVEIIYPFITASDFILGGSSTSTAGFWFDKSATTTNIGNGGTGDSLIELAIDSVSKWIFGADEGTNDFIISQGDTFDSNNALVFEDTDLRAVFGGIVDAPNFVATSTTATSTLPQLTGNVISGFGLSTCNGSTDKLVWSGGLFTCGTDQTGGGSDHTFPFDVRDYGVATSTTIGFENGFLSTASSTLTATTTITSALRVGTSTDLEGRKFQLDGYAELTSSNGAVVIGDTTGQIRGGGSLDIQKGHVTSTRVASGAFAQAFGVNNEASGTHSGAFGYDNVSSGNGAYTFGYTNQATASSTVALGHNIINSLANSFQLGSSDASKLTITSNGSVGLAGETPTYKLHVPGDGFFSSFVDASHFIATSTSATSTFAGGLTYRGDEVLTIIEKSLTNVASSTVDTTFNSFNTATTTFNVWTPSFGVNLDIMYCTTDQGTLLMRAGDGTNWTDPVVCDSDGQELVVDEAFVSREQIVVEIGSQTSDPNEVKSPTFTFTKSGD